MEQTAWIFVAVAILSAVQSVFGMGLLVFGTPTLLLFGVSFSEALGWLLPASVAISAIQVAGNRVQARAIWVNGRSLLCLLPMVVALACVLELNWRAKIDILVGCTMIAASVVRINPGIQRRLARVIVRTENGYLIAMGALHGFTNMGGSLLSLYATATSTSKEGIRGTISAYYLCFGVIQILLLAILKPGVLGPHSAATALLAIAVYLVVGRRLFLNASGFIYDRAITCFIAAYGVAVLVKASLQTG